MAHKLLIHVIKLTLRERERRELRPKKENKDEMEDIL